MGRLVTKDDQVMAWCIDCCRYLDLHSQKRDIVVAAAQQHTKMTGHGIWIEYTELMGSGRGPAYRRYDPSRRDDRREEYLRGGGL